MRVRLKFRSTPDCGEHCEIGLKAIFGGYSVADEFHCNDEQCHGKETGNATTAETGAELPGVPPADELVR
jgi:hypothetical protein